MTDQPNSTMPRQREIGIGIDLGTTKSTVAYLAEDGRPVMLCGADNRPLLVPTAVHFGRTVVVGEPAVELGAEEPDLYAEGFKREMGKPNFHRLIRQQGVPPEVLCAFVLQWLKRESERMLGPVEKAVITVPAYYNETRRKATQEAGRLAGLEVLGIINEPTAAAVAYAYQQRLQGQQQESPAETIMVYDFGGGTFDVSILRIEGRKFSTLATDGDIQLGGCDFDERLADYLAERFVEKHGIDPRGHAGSMHRLWKVAQDAKHRLTGSTKVTAVCTHAGLRVGVEVTRETFEELIDPLIERTLNTCTDVLQEARLDWGRIDRILLVGGSSRVPLVARRLEQSSGKRPVMPDAPELLVAQGAALHAACRSDRQWAGEDAGFDIVNVNAHSLGIEGVDPRTLEPINTILIPRNTTLPASAARKFVTRRDNQPNVAAKVLEGESENPRFCTPIGKCVVELEPDLPAGTEVEVSCHYRADGLIYVAARVLRTKSSADVELRRDRADVLEPLSVWQARLTLDEQPLPRHEPAAAAADLPDEPINASSSAEQLVRRLDYLHSQLGKRAALIALPTAVLPVQRVLHAATRELACVRRILDDLQAKLLRTTDKHEKRQLGVLLASAKAYHSQAQALAAHAQVVLGRECLGAEVCPPGGEPLRDEAVQVLDRLKPISRRFPRTENG
jgi:molecular chaperone DnaK